MAPISFYLLTVDSTDGHFMPMFREATNALNITSTQF